jgi:signal transduction histidine kinase
MLPSAQEREVEVPHQATTDGREELLAGAVMKLARRNEALEEYAALVAHELKAPLQAALATDDPSVFVRQALDLVDTLLALSRETPELGLASPAACLDDVLRDFDTAHVITTAELPVRLPLPPAVLRLLLSNLLRNAVAAGSRSIRVSAKQRSGTWLLEIEDDGVGLDAEERYRAGSGLGLRLCRRLAARYGGCLVVAPGPSGGTQARLELRAAA